MKILSFSQYDIPKVVNEVEKADAAAFVSKLLVWDKRSFPDAEVRMVISPLRRNLDYCEIRTRPAVRRPDCNLPVSISREALTSRAGTVQ
jgi:hypothetical protein